MAIPRIGDAIVFYPVTDPPADRAANALNGTIMAVRLNGTVDVTGTDANGRTFVSHGLPLIQDPAQVPATGHVAYPGFTVAQGTPVPKAGPIPKAK